MLKVGLHIPNPIDKWLLDKVTTNLFTLPRFTYDVKIILKVKGDF